VVATFKDNLNKVKSKSKEGKTVNSKGCLIYIVTNNVIKENAIFKVKRMSKINGGKGKIKAAKIQIRRKTKTRSECFFNFSKYLEIALFNFVIYLYLLNFPQKTYLEETPHFDLSLKIFV